MPVAWRRRSGGARRLQAQSAGRLLSGDAGRLASLQTPVAWRRRASGDTRDAGCLEAPSAYMAAIYTILGAPARVCVAYSRVY